MPSREDCDNNPILRDKFLHKIGKTARQIWIDLGTPAIRHNVYDLTWVNYLLKSEHGEDVLVIPDLRFPNEVAVLREHNALLVKVVRRSIVPSNDVADCALEFFGSWDHVIENDGSIAELHAKLEPVVKWAESFR